VVTTTSPTRRPRVTQSYCAYCPAYLQPSSDCKPHQWPASTCLHATFKVLKFTFKVRKNGYRSDRGVMGIDIISGHACAQVHQLGLCGALCWHQHDQNHRRERLMWRGAYSPFRSAFDCLAMESGDYRIRSDQIISYCAWMTFWETNY
jgi:hypothetical protein